MEQVRPSSPFLWLGWAIGEFPVLVTAAAGEQDNRSVVRGRQINEKAPEPLQRRKAGMANPSELSNGLEPAQEALCVCPVL